MAAMLPPLRQPLAPEGEPAQGESMRGRLEKALDEYFRISARHSTVATEFRAGTTAFLAASNNFIVNAHIMQHAGLDAQVSVVSGAFASAIACILSGVLSNLPMGLVPSVGPNVFLAFSLVSNGVCDTDEALGIACACGLLLLLLALSPALKLILALVPLSIKYGLIIGTGLLTSLIGLKTIGVVVPDTGPSNDIVALGTVCSLEVLIASVFLVAIASMLHNGVKGAVLMGLLGATVVYWAISGDWPASLFELHGMTFHRVDFRMLAHFGGWVQVSALLLMLLFSISGAVIGSARMAGLLREDGRCTGATAVYISCGLGTAVSAALGSSPIFVSMSAAAGIRDGGRTGLVSIVFGLYSLTTALFFSPLASSIPHCAVAPVLILVGVSMVGEAKEVQWWSMLDALPAFLCAIFCPFTYSVANGIYAGVAMSLILFFTTGTFVNYLSCARRRSKSPQLPSGLPAEPIPEDESSPVQREIHETVVLMKHQRSLPTRPKRSLLSSRLPSKMSVSLQELVPEPCAEEESEGKMARDTIHHVGVDAHEEAMHLVQRASKLLGLNEEEVQGWVTERLTAGRNVECHFSGGIPASESYMALAELAELDASSPAMMNVHANEAPLVAAAARRRHRLSGMQSVSTAPANLNLLGR